MKFLIIFIILCGYGTLSLAAKAEDENAAETVNKIPSRIHISYNVKTGIGHGELKEVVNIVQESDTHTFKITSNAQATGIYKVVNPGKILRESRGIITDKGLQPDLFSDRRYKKEPRVSRFDWANKKLIIDNEGNVSEHSLPEFTLDRISFSYNFIFSSLAGDHVDVYVTDGRTLQPMRFNISREKLDTPVGELDTVVLSKRPTEADHFEREIWLATRYNMIPVRIRTVENDGLKIEKMVAEFRLSYAGNEPVVVSCCVQ